MDIEEIKDFVYEVRTFGITSNDAKFVQITEYLLSELEKEKEKNKKVRDMIEYYLIENNSLNDLDKRNKELRKLKKILEE